MMGAARVGQLTHKWTITVIAMLLFGLGVSSARAQPKAPAAAREQAPAQPAERSTAYLEVIQGALVEFEASNYAEARVLFEQAHGIRPSARTLRGMALSSFELREYVRAEQELNAALVDVRQPLTEPQRKEALTLLLRLERYIGRIEVRATPPSATVTLDGRPIRGEVKTELGKHELSVQAPGHREVSRTVTVEGGKRHLLEIALRSNEEAAAEAAVAAAAPSDATPAAPSDATAAAPDDRRGGGILEQWWFWTAVGVVAIGGIATAVALTSSTRVEPALRGNTGPVIQVLTWSR